MFGNISHVAISLVRQEHGPPSFAPEPYKSRYRVASVGTVEAKPPDIVRLPWSGRMADMASALFRICHAAVDIQTHIVTALHV